jgi:hypothetical protein
MVSRLWADGRDRRENIVIRRSRFYIPSVAALIMLEWLQGFASGGNIHEGLIEPFLSDHNSVSRAACRLG